MYNLNNNKIKLITDSYGINFEIILGNSQFTTNNFANCKYIDKDGNNHYFTNLDVEVNEVNEFGKKYLKFNYDKFQLKICIVENSVQFEFCPKENCEDIKEVFWPAPIHRKFSKNGYAVLPIMQGMLIEDIGEEASNILDGFYMSREFTMPWWAQSSEKGSYMATVHTPYDSKYLYNHKKGESTEVQIVWRTSLGKIGYNRKITYEFYDDAYSYVDFCKNYRKYLEEKGKISTLRDKIKKNKNLEKMIGRSVLSPPIIYYNIDPESSHYDRENLENNIVLNSFADTAQILREYKENGLNDAYVHIDGWIYAGYDNQHPRVLPINPQAGGEDGLKEVIQVCKEQNYLLAYHDQYRDYFFKSPDFDNNKAVMHEDGTTTSMEDIVWYGGNEAQLCATQAKAFLERNYTEIEKLGLKPDGVYLDVFSASILDECFNPEHPMTREQCMENRKGCFDYIRNSGMIISSEEIMGDFVDALDIVHHSPYIYAFFEFLNKKPFGICVPLLNLVYHDCIITPWYLSDAVWGLPTGESGFLHCLLNGGAAYLSTSVKKDEISKTKITEKLHREIGLEEMISHEFVDGKHKQKTVFSNGTKVTVDFKLKNYKIEFADESVFEGNV